MVVIGKTDWRGQSRLFGITEADRRRHFYVLGQTGVGKSTLLENMAVQDALAGKGFCVLDPHGQLAEAVLDRLPAHLANRVIYFDPSDDWPISLNVLETDRAGYQDLIASRLVSLFKSIWGPELVGPRSEDILRSAAFALVGMQGATLLWIPRLLVDREFRERVIIPRITNPVIKKFWVEEYNKYGEHFRQEVIAPLQNKLRSFLSVDRVRDVVAQPYRKVSLSYVMDHGQILICNLAKGLIGEDNATLLASLIAEEFYLSALARSRVPEAERRDFFLYADEIQTITGSVLASMLSEARKFRLSLILAHQYLEQIAPDIRQAILGNVGSIVAFRLDARDSSALAQEFSREFRAEDFENLPAHQAYLRLSVEGMTSAPFSMRTLPRPEPGTGSHRERIIKTSRERWGRSREFVEEKISKWLAG